MRWRRWPSLPDGDSLRWSEQPQPIATPSFTRYFRASLLADPAVALLRQNRAPQLTPFPSRPPWQAPAPGRPTADQRRLLRRLTRAEPGIYVMIAPRGRGKSALAGMFAHKLADVCCITAPAKAAVDVLRRYAEPDAPFFAPDALLARCREGVRARWLTQTLLWGGNHFWTLKGNDGLAGSPLLARLTAILRILDSLQKNERKMSFLHYILDWIGRGLSKFDSRLNAF